MDSAASRGFHIPVGNDRHAQSGLKIWGLLPLTNMLSSKDTGGMLYVFQHTDVYKGGPPRHVHHDQDEWFYVIKGEFVAEIGAERFHLKTGDSLFAPRRVPHAWAHVGETPGTLMTAVSPAGTFETFLMDTTRHATLPSPQEIADAFAAHAMTVIGPPLAIE
jgi:mannose-6-phosphate isomerase-like protein (cupin superfamily)